MKPGDEPPWCVFNFERQRFECQRCGQFGGIGMPVKVDFFLEVANGFAAVHARCPETVAKPVSPTTYYRSAFEGRADMQVQLVTREGGHVTTVEMPPFMVLPDVITWGTRFFFLKTLRADDLVYVEALAWAAPVRE